MDIDTNEDDVWTEMELCIRVVMSEDKRFSLVIKRSTNDKIMAIAEELAELLNVTKYSLTFFYKGDKVGLKERLGDRDIGAHAKNSLDTSGENFLLCLKGGNEGPKAWRRFTTIDDPCR
jgi:hypothetical protein